VGKVIIYQDGHTYEIDSDLIYQPVFEKKEDKNDKEESGHHTDLHSG